MGNVEFCKAGISHTAFWLADDSSDPQLSSVVLKSVAVKRLHIIFYISRMNVDLETLSSALIYLLISPKLLWVKPHLAQVNRKHSGDTLDHNLAVNLPLWHVWVRQKCHSLKHNFFYKCTGGQSHDFSQETLVVKVALDCKDVQMGSDFCCFFSLPKLHIYITF